MTLAQQNIKNEGPGSHRPGKRGSAGGKSITKTQEDERGRKLSGGTGRFKNYAGTNNGLKKERETMRAENDEGREAGASLRRSPC